MRLIQIAGLAVGVLAAGAAFAQSGADVVKAKGCLNCHAVDTKKMGPSFKDIAAKRATRPPWQASSRTARVTSRSPPPTPSSKRLSNTCCRRNKLRWRPSPERRRAGSSRGHGAA